MSETAPEGWDTHGGEEGAPLPGWREEVRRNHLQQQVDTVRHPPTSHWQHSCKRNGRARRHHLPLASAGELHQRRVHLPTGQNPPRRWLRLLWALKDHKHHTRHTRHTRHRR